MLLHTLSVHTSFSCIQAKHVPAVAHIASHNKGTANSISLPSSWHYLSCMSMVREDAQSPTENREGRNNSALPKEMCSFSEAWKKMEQDQPVILCAQEWYRQVPQTRLGTWTILQTALVASAATCSVQEKSTAFSLPILTHAWLSNTWTVHTGPVFCQREEKGNTFHRNLMDCINFQTELI